MSECAVRWTCPKGHERQLDCDLREVRELVALLALTAQCAECQAGYLLPPETQHRVLRHFEEQVLRAWLGGARVSIDGRLWTFTLDSLRLIARFPPDVAEIEVMAAADESMPRVRIVVRVSLDVLQSKKRLTGKLRSELERRLGRS